MKHIYRTCLVVRSYICGCRIFSRSVFKFDQRGVSSHLVVYANKYSLDYAADFGFNIVFHLLGLLDQQGVSRLDFLTWFYVD